MKLLRMLSVCNRFYWGKLTTIFRGYSSRLTNYMRSKKCVLIVHSALEIHLSSWQLPRVLSRFAKNLDPNSISLKFLKGEGELNNLELNEAVLSDLLEFPPWLQLTKVTCNKISAKVPWTTLKSDAIKLVLDQVEVEMEASEVAREKAKNLPALNNMKPGKYGFSEKVVDGMYVSINTLLVSFTSLGFKASVNISRIIVQSTTPDWQPTGNLRNTRIKDEVKGEVLTFKEIVWGTMRVDADAAYKPGSKEMPSTPLRLITNNGTIRLVIKKRLSDCSMVASKLIVILDDILWVLTRSQLLKLSSFVHYMVKLRSKFLPLTRESAPSSTQPTHTPPQTASQDQLFSAYDLPETSFHLHNHRIDLHLCDDSTLQGNLQNQNDSQNTHDGAALQISVMAISVDHCPYHLASTKRSVVKSDEEVMFQRMRWAHELLNNFQETEGKSVRPRRSMNTYGNLDGAVYRKPTMYESFTVFNCQNFNIMQVTTAKSPEPKPFLSSEKEALFLPLEMAAVHFDHTMYYYTGGNDLPVPAPNVFLKVNPIQLTFDPLTCVWLNRFAQSVAMGLDWTKEFMSREPGFVEHVNVRIEALMPKVRIPMKNDKGKPHFGERPSCMQIQISQAVVSNCRIGAKCSQSDVLNDLQHFISSRLYADMTCFPNEKDDIPPLSNSSWLNDYSVNHYQINKMTKRDKELYSRLARDDNLPHQIWCICCDQVWVEFLGTPKLGSRRITFVDAFPLRLWLCEKVPYHDFHLFSETSSIRGSDIEVASEFVDQNYPIRQMNVVYDSEKGPVTTTQNKERRRSHSEKNPHHENKRLLDIATGGYDEPAHLLNASSYTLEDINEMRNIRSSHSESDLLQIRDQELVSGSASVHDINYAQGGPPPPYYSSDLKIVSSSVSMTSLPPAYETISEEPGPIVKPAIEDFKICGTERFFENQTATMAILLNIDKPILVQMEHFHLLYLLRVGEAVAKMTESINMDNMLCKKERAASLNHWSDVKQTSKAEESLILNARIPDIIVDIVLPPCIGIDPVQRLTLPERVQYEKEKLESITESLNRESLLPLRKISMQNAVLENANISENFRNTDVTLANNDVLYRENGIAISADIDGACNSRDNSGYFEDVMPYPEQYKESKDEAIQVGEPLMTVNLKPLPEDQLISVLQIQASIITLTVQSKEDDSVVKVAAETLRINELGNMKYGKVVDPRGHTPSKDSDKQQVNMNTITGDCVFKMRLLSGPKADEFVTGSKDVGFADIRVKSVVAALLMSTIDNLTEFGEDEYILPVMPFTVSVSESDISLYDDKPRSYKSNAKLPPLQVLLSGLTIERDINGVIKLNQKSPIEEAHSVPGEMDGIVSRNQNSSMIAESINQQIEALITENGRLLEDLKVVNAKVNGLHTERESLLKVIDKLQKELIYSNRENDDLHMRVRSLSLRKQKGHYI